MEIRAGASGEVRHVVTADDTAAVLGSGDVPVLGTPRLLALAEAATVAALDGQLGSTLTTVGTRVELDHLAATPVGGTVVVLAELVEVDGRALTFAVTATDTHAEIGRGRIARMIVDRERFLRRLRPSSATLGEHDG